MGLDSKQALVGVTLGCYKEEVLGWALQPTTAGEAVGKVRISVSCFLFLGLYTSKTAWLKGWSPEV